MGFGDWISGAFHAVVNTVSDVAKKVGGTVSHALKGAWGGVKKAAAGVYGVAKTVVNKTYDAGKGVVNWVGKEVDTVVQGTAGLLKTLSNPLVLLAIGGGALLIFMKK